MRQAVVIHQKKAQYAPIVDALQRTGIAVLDFNDDLQPYDALIVFHNKYYSPLHTEAKVGWWMCDYRTPFDLVRHPGHQVADHIFLATANHIGWYADHFGVPATFMPQCGVEWPMVPGRDLKADAVFIGNVTDQGPYHHNRGAILHEVARCCTLHHLRGERTTTDMRFIYANTPISVNITPPGMAGTSNRLYNIISSGGLCLTTWFDGIEKQFENWKHLVWFNDRAELFHIIDRLLHEPRLAASIRANGQSLYASHHTAAHRLHNMFGILTGTVSGFQGYLQPKTTEV